MNSNCVCATVKNSGVSSSSHFLLHTATANQLLKLSRYIVIIMIISIFMIKTAAATRGCSCKLLIIIKTFRNSVSAAATATAVVADDDAKSHQTVKGNKQRQ